MEKETPIKFISLGAANSIQYSEAPSYGTTDRYIKYGADNQFDKYLYELSQKSALHAGILDKKVLLDTGKGLSWDESNKKMNDLYGSLEKDFTSNVFQSLEILGGFFIGVKWFKGQIVGLEFIPFDYCRLGEPDENDNINYILVSKNWKKSNTTKYRPVSFPVYTGEYKKNEYEIAYIFKNTLGQWYPRPVYFAACNYIQSDWEISKFHLSNILNGFNAGAFIVFTDGTPSPETQRAVEAEIKKNTGPEAAGKFILYYAENKDNAPVITQLPTSDLHEQYNSLNSIIDNKIVLAHQTYRIICGLETAGSLGDSKQLYQAQEAFMSSYIIPQQQILLNFLNEVNEINGINEEVTIEQSKSPNTALVIGMISEVREYFTKEEIRSIFGFENTEQTTITE